MATKQEQVLEQLFDIGKNMGGGSVAHPHIPTQFPEFNEHILGIGGFPRGRIVEIAAEENCGKTTVCANFCGYWQKQKMKIAYAAAEPIDYNWFTHCGCDMRTKEQGCENPIYIMDKEKGATNSEDYASKMKTVLAYDIFDIIITDSMEAVNPIETIVSDGGLSMYDKQANATFWGNFLRSLEGGFVGYHDGKEIKNSTPIQEWKLGKLTDNYSVHKLEQKKACFILINHLKPGVGLYAAKYTKGGKNKDFRFSHRIWMSIAKTYKAKKDGVEFVKGRDIKFLLKKGKLGAPTGRNMILKFENGIFSETGEKGTEEVRNEDE